MLGYYLNQQLFPLNLQIFCLKHSLQVKCSLTSSGQCHVSPPQDRHLYILVIPGCVCVCRSAGRTSDILGRLQRRRAAAGAQAVARERKVNLMRKYRTGELPDVQQLSIAAFLGPLGKPNCKFYLVNPKPHSLSPELTLSQ